MRIIQIIQSALRTITPTLRLIASLLINLDSNETGRDDEAGKALMFAAGVAESIQNGGGLPTLPLELITQEVKDQIIKEYLNKQKPLISSPATSDKPLES